MSRTSTHLPMDGSSRPDSLSRMLGKVLQDRRSDRTKAVRPLQRVRRWLIVAWMGVGVAAPATAGTVTVLDGTSGAAVFTGALDLTTDRELQLGFFVDYLVVGGGGSGGTAGQSSGTGGGGAGGFVEGRMQISSSNYGVTVGAGGVAPNKAGTISVQGNNGGSSAFGSVTAAGGGGGGRFNTAGNSGGSGGGAGGRNTTAGGTGNSPSLTPAQGNNGGSSRGGDSTGSAAGGGGGGAGSAGGNAATNANTAGNGGDGRTSTITGGSVIYAGGGGGGSVNTAGSGGSGVGGQGGGSGQNPGSGAANTGSGGGGAGVDFKGGDGGSGVVIVRYEGSALSGLTTPGGNETTISGGDGSPGYTVHRFGDIGSGSAFDASAANLGNRLKGTQTGTITGSGNLKFSGPGELTLDAANTYSGTTRAAAGTLKIGHVNALSGSTLDMDATDSGTVNFSLSGQTYNVGGLQGSRDLAAGDNSLSVGANNASTTYSGALSGTGGLTKTGSGALNLSGTNAYTGTTTVAEGKLLINGSTAGAAVTVQSGASLGGSGTVGGATTFLNGSFHTPGNSPDIQTFTGGLTYNTGSTFEWELIGNTVALRGINYDGVDVSASPLTIQTGVTSALVFNIGSTVNWSDAFWGSNQSWQVFTSTAGFTFDSAFIFDTITLTNDSLSQSLASVRSDSYFSWSSSGNDLFLDYNVSPAAVPEPGAFIALGGLASIVLGRRRLGRKGTPAQPAGT